MSWRDILVRYKQTVLGVAWAVLQPFTTMVIFTFIFNRVAKIESGDGTPYPVFVFVGLLLWQYFAATVTNLSNSMVGSAGLIQKVYFPRLIIPVSSAATTTVDLGISSIMLAVLMAVYGCTPRLEALLVVPLALACVVLSAVGMGLFLSAVNIKFRDVRHAVPFVIQTLMYVTPVVYPTAMLDTYPVAKKAMLWLNPIAGVMTNTRASLLGAGTTDWGTLVIGVFTSAAIFLLGVRYFRRTEYYFADIV